MPDLSSDQFQPRLFDPGPADHGPRRGEGAPIADSDTGVRGPAGEGQFVMNFDRPQTGPLMAGKGGIVGVDEWADPTFTGSAWNIGGGHRNRESISSTWESAPVETIPAERELRSNQIEEAHVKTGRAVEGGAYRPHKALATGNELVDGMMGNTPAKEYDRFEVGLHSPGQVESLRKSAKFSDRKASQVRAQERGASRDLELFEETERLPWIARIEEEKGNPKDYIMEGHHRTVASRTRGDGSMQAHVLKARPGHSMDQFLADFRHQPKKLHRSWEQRS